MITACRIEKYAPEKYMVICSAGHLVISFDSKEEPFAGSKLEHRIGSNLLHCSQCTEELHRDYEELHGQPDDVNEDEYFERDTDVPDAEGDEDATLP